jgi:hypothetical protein
MKPLDRIKNDYARQHKFGSWDQFCLGANDRMFEKAVDDIARLYAAHRLQYILAPTYISGSATEEMLLAGRSA